MNKLYLSLLLLAEEATGTGSEEAASTTEDTTDKLMNAMKEMVKSPIFYIVIGALVLLIIAVYLLRRIVKPSSGVIKVVVRSGKIHKLIDENSSNYFMVPFRDSLGAVISLSEKEFNSDKLFINDGPDALYKINYNLKYHIVDVTKFFPYRDSFQNMVVIEINDKLREYADEGHALDIVKGYRENASKLLSLINSVTDKYGVEALALKVNFIEPLGKK